MSWESRYLAPDPTVWHGRNDIPADSCFFQHVQRVNLLNDKLPKANANTFGLVGFKCDEGVQRDLGRTGAFEGPLAIRQRLTRLPIQRTDLVCYDVGNIVCTDHDLEASQAALGHVVSELLSNNIHPIIMGGGHEVSWGHYQGIAKALAPEKRLSIVSFDAHFDLHDTHPIDRGSATTTFHQIAQDHKLKNRPFQYNCIGIQHAGNIRHSFDTARDMGVKFILADDLHMGQNQTCFDFVERIIDESDAIYISLSLDVFSPAFAPGVSTIQPLGLNPWHVIPLLRQLAGSGKVISYDFSEHVPRYDIDHRTAKLAATLIYDVMHNHRE